MTEFRASRETDREALTRLWQEAFGDERSFIDAFFETGYAPERSRVAVENGELAGMLYWFDCELGERKIAYIYAVATDERFRGQGIASRLMADVHALLESEGYAAAALSPGEESLFRFYEKLGYVTAGYREERRFTAGVPIPVREVGREEYASIRAKLLPENGLRQEGASLAFLHRLARFYAGEGFCAAVSREGAYCPEFLGDEKHLPGLLGSLGLTEAVVRTPGGRVPCVMAKWLSMEDKSGIYLGFVFD